MYLRNQECRVRYYLGNFLDTNYTYYSQKCWNFPKQRNSNKKSIALIFRDVELVMVIWYFMQMSSILCMFEETKNCQVLNMWVLETKNVRYIPRILTKPGMFKYILCLFEGTQNVKYFMCVFKNPTSWEYFSCVFWENKKCPTLHAYSRNHKCGVFYRNANYFMHIQENTKCWLCYISIQETMNAEYFM